MNSLTKSINNSITKAIVSSVKGYVKEFASKLASEIASIDDIDEEKIIEIWNAIASEFQLSKKKKVNEESEKCSHIIKTGVNKDKECGKSVSQKSESKKFCNKHCKNENKGEVKKCEFSIKSGDRKGEDCGANVSSKSKSGCYCSKHCKNEDKVKEKRSVKSGNKKKKSEEVDEVKKKPVKSGSSSKKKKSEKEVEEEEVDEEEVEEEEVDEEEVEKIDLKIKKFKEGELKGLYYFKNSTTNQKFIIDKNTNKIIGKEVDGKKVNITSNDKNVIDNEYGESTY